MKIELLEKAAAAVGIEHSGWVDHVSIGRGLWTPHGNDPTLVTRLAWNPWDDNGDALCLAMHCGVSHGALRTRALVHGLHAGRYVLDLAVQPLTPLERLAWLREHIVREVVARNNQNGLYWQNTNTGETK